MVAKALVDRQDRSANIAVHAYEVLLDLTVPGNTFRSRTEVRFGCRCEGASVLSDLHAAEVERVTLNEEELMASDLYRPGQLELPGLSSENTVVVEAAFEYSETGTGMQRVESIGDRPACVYGKGNRGGASQMFCCFDQTDLRAPITLIVRVPDEWGCQANYPATIPAVGGERGLWRFAPTAPLAPYLVALCAGPNHLLVETRGSPAPMTVRTLAGAGEPRRAQIILDIAHDSLRHYERALGVAFPYPKCDLVAVPELRPLAFTAPGLCLIQDRLLEPNDDESPGYLACVIAHEMAHAWFGGVVDMHLEADMWLQEALATYVSRTALEAIWAGSDPWDPAVAASLPDHAYSAQTAALRQLEAMVGRPAVQNGLSALMRRRPFATVTVDDLVRSWSEASRRDLADWANTLRSSARQH